MASDLPARAMLLAIAVLSTASSARAQTAPVDSPPPAPVDPPAPADTPASPVDPPVVPPIDPPADPPAPPPPATSTPVTSNPPATTPPVTPPPAIPRVRWPKPRPFKIMAGFEVGHAWTADSDQLYGNGSGRTFVLGIQNFEIRLLENYDLEDRSGGMFDADGGQGRFGITSTGYRLLLSAGRVSVRPIVGLAWLRRTSLRYDEASLVGGAYHETMSQHGIGAMLGGGIGLRLGLLDVSVDARAYPAWWSEIGGDRAVIRNDVVVFEPITESPGGMPYTLTATIAIGY